MPRIGPFVAAFAALSGVSLWFFLRQNSGAQIGGAMSVPKILWLNYAIGAWFILPFFLARSPLLSQKLRRVFAAHLLNFSVRAVIELYLLYVTVSWSPLYGIAHDVFSIALIAVLARGADERTVIPSVSGGSGREGTRSAPHAQVPRYARNDTATDAAYHFTWSLRITLMCEIVFAALFHRLTAAEHAIYFASDEPRFRMINIITSVVVVAAYADLARVIARLRGRSMQEVAAHA